MLNGTTFGEAIFSTLISIVFPLWIPITIYTWFNYFKYN